MIADAGPRGRGYFWQRMDADSMTPEAIRRAVDADMGEYKRRREFCESYAWAVPSREAVAEAAAFVAGRTLLEVGAGRGLWARLLRDAGAEVVATDGYREEDAFYYGGGATYAEVERLDAVAAVKAHRECAALLLCWPPMTDMADRALRAFKGDRLVYVGEWEGCTAEEKFFHRLERWAGRLVPIPQWPGIHDDLWLFER